MASAPKPEYNNSSTNKTCLGKRKKPRTGKGSYLSKWLDKTMHHIQESAPSMDTFDSLVNTNSHWPNPYAPCFDQGRFIYGYTPEPMSLPTVPTYYNSSMMPHYYGPEYRYVQGASKGVQVHRPRQRRNKAEEVHSTPNETPNGTLDKNYMKNFTDSQDFTSLPPIITSVGDTTSNSDLHTNEKDDISNNRRFSDPCIQGLPDVARPANVEVDSGSEASSNGSHVGARLLACLLDQINTLKITNERLNKELQETKAELHSVRQQNALWQKSSGSSLGGTPNHSPHANGLLGSGYSPGLVSELVREVRDAARLREDALYARISATCRSENGLSNDGKLSDRCLDDIKLSLNAAETDKRRMMDRINKLEDDLRSLKISNGVDTTTCSQNGSADEAECERLRLRKEVAELRKAKLNAEEHSHKLERIVTQLRSKFNGVQIPTNGESLASESEFDASTRVRRTSVNSANSTVVFGPVTDL